MSILVNAQEHEVSKAYTAGTITYHQAAASEEGRKKRAATSRAKTGVGIAAGGAYLHSNAGRIGHAAADHVAQASGDRDMVRHGANVARNFKAIRGAGKVGVAGGAALAVSGAASAAVHGERRKKHFAAAQQGRLQREPAVIANPRKAIGKSNQFGIVVNSAEHEISKNYALKPRRPQPGTKPAPKTIRKGLGKDLGIGAVGGAATVGGMALLAPKKTGAAVGAVKSAAADLKPVKALTSVIGKNALAAVDDVALAPMKIKNVKNTLSGNGQPKPNAPSANPQEVGHTAGTAVNADIQDVTAQANPEAQVSKAFGVVVAKAFPLSDEYKAAKKGLMTGGSSALGKTPKQLIGPKLADAKAGMVKAVLKKSGESPKAEMLERSRLQKEAKARQFREGSSGAGASNKTVGMLRAAAKAR